MLHSRHATLLALLCTLPYCTADSVRIVTGGSPQHGSTAPYTVHAFKAGGASRCTLRTFAPGTGQVEQFASPCPYGLDQAEYIRIDAKADDWYIESLQVDTGSGFQQWAVAGLGGATSAWLAQGTYDAVEWRRAEHIVAIITTETDSGAETVSSFDLDVEFVTGAPPCRIGRVNGAVSGQTVVVPATCPYVDRYDVKGVRVTALGADRWHLGKVVVYFPTSNLESTLKLSGSVDGWVSTVSMNRRLWEVPNHFASPGSPMSKLRVTTAGDSSVLASTFRYEVRQEAFDGSSCSCGTLMPHRNQAHYLTLCMAEAATRYVLAVGTGKVHPWKIARVEVVAEGVPPGTGRSMWLQWFNKDNSDSTTGVVDGNVVTWHRKSFIRVRFTTDSQLASASNNTFSVLVQGVNGATCTGVVMAPVGTVTMTVTGCPFHPDDVASVTVSSTGTDAWLVAAVGLPDKSTTDALVVLPSGSLSATLGVATWVVVPQTDAPTLVPATPEPPTSAPATPAPGTPAPATLVPLTPAPLTLAPETLAPATPAPATPVPPTPAPSTPAPTLVPSTPAPGTLAPTTPAPATSAPPTPAPATPTPGTLAPATPAPVTPVPSTAASATLAPSTFVPPTPAPVTAAPPTPPAATSAPATSTPATSVSATLAPATAAPPTPPAATSAPATSTPPTLAPATSVSTTPAPGTAAPPTPPAATSAPATSTPPTLAPATSVSTTPAPAISALTTPSAATSAPATSTPTTLAPATSVPATPAPAMSALTTPSAGTLLPASPTPSTPVSAPLTPTPTPPTLAPATPVPATTAPPTPVPATPAPATPAPPTSAPPTPAPGTDTPPTTPPATPAPAGPPQGTPPPTAAPTTLPATQLPETMAPPTQAPPTPAPPVGLAPTLGRETAAPQDATTPADSVDGFAVAAAAATLSASAAGTPVRLAIIARGCSTADSPVFNPTGLVIAHSHIVGSVVANQASVLAVAVLGYMLLAAARLCGNRLAPHHFRGLDVQGCLRLPSVPVMVWELFFPALVLEGTHLMLQPGSTAQLLLGITATLASAVVPCLLFKVVQSGAPRNAVYALVEGRRGLSSALLGPGEWVNTNPNKMWAERHTSLLRPFRQGMQWFLALEHAAGFAVAAAHGILSTSDAGCGHIKACSGLVFLTMLVIEVVCRPRAHLRDTAFDITLHALSATAMFLMAFGYYAGNVNLWVFSAASALLSCCTGVLVLRGVLDFACETYVVCTGKRDRLQGDVMARQGSAWEACDTEAPTGLVSTPPSMTNSFGGNLIQSSGLNIGSVVSIDTPSRMDSLDCLLGTPQPGRAQSLHDLAPQPSCAHPPVTRSYSHGPALRGRGSVRQLPLSHAQGKLSSGLKSP